MYEIILKMFALSAKTIKSIKKRRRHEKKKKLCND